MEGEASAWYQWMDRNQMFGLGDRGKFVKEVKNRFGHSAYEDPLGKNSKLTQSGIMVRFCADFEELLNQVEAIPESILMIFFCLWTEGRNSKGITVSTTKDVNRGNGEGTIV